MAYLSLQLHPGFWFLDRAISPAQNNLSTPDESQSSLRHSFCHMSWQLARRPDELNKSTTNPDHQEPKWDWHDFKHSFCIPLLVFSVSDTVSNPKWVLPLLSLGSDRVVDADCKNLFQIRPLATWSIADEEKTGPTRSKDRKTPQFEIGIIFNDSVLVRNHLVSVEDYQESISPIS